MTSNRQVSPPLLPTTRISIISESVSVTSTKLPSDNLYNISYLFKHMRGERTSKYSLSSIERQNTSKMISSLPENNISYHQRQTITNTPMHAHKKTAKKLDIHQSNTKFHNRQQKFFKSEKDEKHQFNNAAYCVAYCTIIIIGVTIGGWIGGLFELISGGNNGCNNEHRGNFKCHIKYASFNITTHCINIFYKKSISNNSPYICLCRFRNNSKAKYRDCEFLHAKIQKN